TEQIEIGAVEHVNGLRHGWSSPEVSRFIGTSCVKGKPLAHMSEKWIPVFRQGYAPLKDARACPDSNGTGHALAPKAKEREGHLASRSPTRSECGKAQQAALPQRARLTFSLSAGRPTAPTTTSLPIT